MAPIEQLQRLEQQWQQQLFEQQQSDVEKIFINNPANLREFLQYFEDAVPTWVLEPTEITVEQPDNQEELIGELFKKLSSQQDGKKLQQQLQLNLYMLKDEQEHPERPNSLSSLNIRAGHNLPDDLRQPGHKRTREEREKSMIATWEDREKIKKPEQPNVMVTGLLRATGAEVLRNDIGEDGHFRRIYKGMLDGQPVYFKEMIYSQEVIWDFPTDPNPEITTHLARIFYVLSEQTARDELSVLSAEDLDVLRSFGYHPDTYPDRSRMIEIIQSLYADMAPTGENVQ